MIPQVSRRMIGNVMIVDIKGSVTGFWAERVRAEIENIMSEKPMDKAMLNLQKVTNLDSLGVRALFSGIEGNGSIGVLRGSRCVMDVVSHFYDVRKIMLFENEYDVITSFGGSMVMKVDEKERRAHPRLQTALPLEFFRVGDEDAVSFHAVITNLSLGGLFAEYIDLKHAEESLLRLSPYDLKVLRIRIFFPKGKVVEVEGKVVHRRLDGDQLGIGIEFCRVGLDEQCEIDAFLRVQEGFIDS